MKKFFCLILVLLCLIPQTAFAAAAPKLAAPTNLKATALDYCTINLSWSAVKGAKGYRIYYKNDGKFVYLRSVIATQYIDTFCLEEQKTYSYKVCAYAISGGKTIYSAMSAPVTVSTPSSLTIHVDNLSSNTNMLSWSTYDGAAGYDIYRASTANGTYQCIATTTKLKYTDSGLSPNTTYYYKVKYYNLKNDVKTGGGFSKLLTAKTLPVGKSYLYVCFVGNEYTSVPQTDVQFQKLCDKTGKVVRVFHDILEGASLTDHTVQYDQGYFEDERKLADIVIYQEYDAWATTPKIIDRINRYYPKDSKKYYMTARALPWSAFPYIQTYDIPDLTTLQTQYLFYELIQEEDRSLFYDEDPYHPGVMWGYACASLIYCTLFHTDPYKLPYDFIDPATIPGSTTKEKAAFIKYIKDKVDWAMGQ